MKLLICCIIVCSACFICSSAKDFKNEKQKRVCIIGAGVAGLLSARYLKEEGINFTVLEATKYVGGTWRYDPRTGVDENGISIHTSMYKHLRTNLPKPTMELRGFSLPEGIPSYPSWEIFYNYLKSYAKHFDIEKYIKFEHIVILVRRENNEWKVRYKNVVTHEVFEEYFDFVVVGNGHHSKPNMPNIPGEDMFKGTIIHSHDYRLPDPYKGRRVLVVGAGPSGMDISLDIAEVSSLLVHSHHSKINWKTKFPPHYVKKPDIKEYNESGVVFEDGSYQDIDDVVYCTGYQFDYPFLDETSELSITPKAITPLHFSMLNINQPTMVIMGLVVRACIVVSMDAQARYMTALVKGNFTLPSRDEMMEQWQRRVDYIKEKGLPMSALHVLSYDEDNYYEELTKESGIERVPPVMVKIRTQDILSKIEDLYEYRNYEYKIIDNNTFIRTYVKH